MGSVPSAAGKETNGNKRHTNGLKQPTQNAEPKQGEHALNHTYTSRASMDSNNSDANSNISTDSDDIYTDSDSEEDVVMVTVDFNKFKEQTFENLKESTKNLQGGISVISSNDELLSIVLEELSFISQLYFEGEEKGFERPLYEKYQRELCDLMLKMDFLKVFVQLLEEIPKDADSMAKTTAHNQIIVLVIGILHNCTDISDVFAIETAKTKIMEVTKSILDANSANTIELEMLMTDVIKSCHGIVHNVSMREKNVARLRSLDFTTTIAPYLKHQDAIIRIAALTTLANIVTEKECLIIGNHIRVVAQLLMLLNEAMDTESRRCNGWSCKECVLAIRQLARNDANKKLLHELKALQSLIELARSQDKEEQIESILAILALSFDDDIRADMTKTSELGAVDLLLDLNESSDDQNIKSACEKTLWNLKDDLLTSPITSYKKAGPENITTLNQSTGRLFTAATQALKGCCCEGARMQTQNKPDTNTGHTGHVMISYQRNDRKFLLTIRDKLKNNGFEVWMDVDRMGGCVYETMANAVENANIFLMCYSRKYKESENCQYEAKYAHKKKKAVIPLKMERDYDPDGWLGLLLKSDYFLEFSGKYDHEEKFKEMLKQIKTLWPSGQVLVDTPVIVKVDSPCPIVTGVCGARNAENAVENTDLRCKILPQEQQPVVADGIDEVDAPPKIRTNRSEERRQIPCSARINIIKGWNQQDIDRWLEINNLKNQGVNKITALEISLMARMLVEVPEQLYECLRQDLKIKTLSTKAKIVWALDDLVNMEN